MQFALCRRTGRRRSTSSADLLTMVSAPPSGVTPSMPTGTPASGTGLMVQSYLDGAGMSCREGLAQASVQM